MGDYAVDQMMLEFNEVTGITGERSDFESEVRTLKKHICPKCGKRFKAHIAVRDHMRDKHGDPAVGAA